MKRSRPILFKTDMVQAILNGSKTQTRRIVKPHYLERGSTPYHTIKKSPYGLPGDQLWVKEHYYAVGYWEKFALTKTMKCKYKFVDLTLRDGHEYIYQADKTIEHTEKQFSQVIGWYKRNSLFMPQIASRITLEITNIRVERLNAISKDDTYAEGVDGVIEFHNLWEKINGKSSWEANPWVWAINFKMIKP